MKNKIVAVLILSSIRAVAGEAPPSWIYNHNRQVISGDIVHWGTGDADAPDVAVFKARQMAIKTLIEECGGVANKEIVPRKQYVMTDGAIYRGYAQVSLDFQSCEVAKHHGGDRLENPEIRADQARYNKLVFFQQRSGDEEGKKQLQDMEREIKEQMKDHAAEQEGMLQRMKNEISALRQTIEEKNQPQEPKRDPAEINSMKQACLTKLNQLQFRADMHAGPGGVWRDEDQQDYWMQRSMCQRMK